MPEFALGRKSPKNAPHLRLSQILTGQTPSYPPAVDHLRLGGWQMLGNDMYGDCVAVTWANERRLMTNQAGTEKYPSFDDVMAFYRTQNPNFPAQDDGMDIQTALERLVHEGGPDGVKALAFAKVDHTSADQVKAALSIFGCIWVGINVQQAQMDQFDQNQPWQWVEGSQDLGGHSIIVGGYDSDQVAGDETFVTWAQETSFTDEFWGKGVEEAWVVIWPEHLVAPAFQQGVNGQALAAAYEAVTGRAFPVPLPEPKPLPAPDEAATQLVDVGTKYLASRYHSAKLIHQLREALTAWIATQS